MNDRMADEATCGVDQPPFDYQSSLARAAGDESLLCEMAGLFIESSPGLLSDLARGLTDADAPQVYRAAHALKGSAANFNASAVVALAARLEALGRGGNLAGAQADFDGLCRETDLLCAALRRLVLTAAPS